jgi:hypothetical protein
MDRCLFVGSLFLILVCSGPADIAFVMLLKTKATKPFAGHPVIDHLLELRAFIGVQLGTLLQNFVVLLMGVWGLHSHALAYFP